MGALIALQLVLVWIVYVSTAAASTVRECSGYTLKELRETPFQVEADLELIGEGCGVYGPDIPRLALTVTYETGMFTEECEACLVV